MTEWHVEDPEIPTLDPGVDRADAQPEVHQLAPSDQPVLSGCQAPDLLFWSIGASTVHYTVDATVGVSSPPEA